MRSKLTKISLITFILLGLVVPNGFLIQAGTVIYVPDDYSTIQAAVDGANSGDTIIVRDGTYTENIRINKFLTIKSENGAKQTIVQAADSNDSVFKILANNITLNGFTIKGGKFGILFDVIVDIYGHHRIADYSIISNNIITENSTGIYSYGTCKNPKGWFCLMDYSTNNVVADNDVVANNNGGIFFTAHESSWLGPNKGKSNNIIENNNISDNSGLGIELQGAYNKLLNNHISNNNSGVYLYGWSTGGRNIIIGNTISDNRGYGIRFAYSGGNEVYHNNFIDNLEQVKSYNSGNYFYKEYPEGGNYWSDYLGVDEKSGPDQDQPGSDGIGDTSYTFTSRDCHLMGCYTTVHEDKYPFIRKSGWEAPDFWIEEIKPVQVVWDSKIDDNNSIDLVFGKSTMVRLEVGMENCESLDKATQLEINLFLPDPTGDFLIPKTYSYTIDQLLAMDKQIDVYLDFDLPLGDYTITAEVYPPSDIEESDPSNNEDSVDITVKDTYDLDIRYFKIKPPEDLETHKPLYKPVEKYEETAEKNSEFFQAVYPLADGTIYPVPENTIRKEPIIGSKILGEKGIKKDAVEVSNQAKRLGADRGIGIVSFGPLDDYFRYHGSTAGGMAFRNVVRNVEGVIVGDHLWTTVAHEIGHTYNLYLPPCFHWPPQECEEADIYPPDGRPANGFWVVRQQEIENRICFMGETNDNEKFDDTWVCNKCYGDLFRKLREDKKDPEILILSGIMYKNGSIELEKWYRVKEGKDDLDTIIPGDYLIQILDENTNVLEEISFLIEFLETDSQPFSFAVPYPQGASIVKIFYQSQILTEFDLARHLFASAIDTLPSDYDMLIEGIKEASIQQGIKNSLTSKLSNAKKKVEQGIAYIKEGQHKKGSNMLNSASNIIQAFVSEMKAQKGREISEGDANKFIEWTEKTILILQNQIIETL